MKTISHFLRVEPLTKTYFPVDFYDMASLSAVRVNEDLKNYYQRKTQEEKKNKMSVLNAVRNKLIQRVFACVHQNRKYNKIYTT